MKLPLHQQFQALPDSPWEFVFLGLDLLTPAASDFDIKTR